MEHKDKHIISKPALEGQVGENAVWEVNKYPSKYYPGPITQIAKRG